MGCWDVDVGMGWVASRNTPLRDPTSCHAGEMVRDLRGEVAKCEENGQNAQTALMLLRQKCPGLPQTALDGYKIQYNRVRTTHALAPHAQPTNRPGD